MPGIRLTGLIDPDRPALPAAVRAGLDGVVANPYLAGQPGCFVRPTPDDDPLFAARLLLRPDVPSVAVMPGFKPGAVARYWLARTDAVVPAASVWPTVAGLFGPADRAESALALLTLDRTAPLPRALGCPAFGPERLPLLSARFGRIVFVIGNREADAALIALLRRHGGDVVLEDSCLLAAYAADPARATQLAEAELGRAVPPGELQQWIDGIARPPALLLGEVAGAADRLFVPSAFLAAEINGRYGRAATVLPHAVAPSASETPGVVRAAAAGLQAEACVWAAEMLQVWEVPVRIELECAPAEQPALQALVRQLGVSARLGFTPGPVGLGLFLAMRGQGSRSAALAGAAAAGLRCIASRSVVEGTDAPPWVRAIPDQPSPPLLADAIRIALEQPTPDPAEVSVWRARHAPDAVAAQLRAALR